MKDSIRFFTIWGAKWKEFKNRFYLSLLAGMSPSTASEKKRKKGAHVSYAYVTHSTDGHTFTYYQVM